VAFSRRACSPRLCAVAACAEPVIGLESRRSSRDPCRQLAVTPLAPRSAAASRCRGGPRPARCAFDRRRCVRPGAARPDAELRSDAHPGGQLSTQLDEGLSPPRCTGALAAAAAPGMLLSSRRSPVGAPAPANHLDQVMRGRLTDRNAPRVLWTKMPSRLDQRFAISRWISSLRRDRPSSHPPQEGAT